MKGLNDPIWLEHLRSSIGEERSSILLDALGLEPSVSVRKNPLKRADLDFGCSTSVVDWCKEGLILEKRPVFTLDPLFHAGAYYVQDSSSMYVGHILRTLLGDAKRFRALDLCAAPGGKTTDFASSLRERYADDFLLVSNEVMKLRASTLSDNVALWGDPNVQVTSADPAAFASFEGCFDLILTDVPCSGEGMFRKDKLAVRDWSENTVDLCWKRQRRILADVWPSLRKGGILIYSTCTFEEKENDGNVRWICENLGAEPLLKGVEPIYPQVLATEYGHLLVPGLVPGEGQYVSALRKTGGSDRAGGYENALERMRLRSREEDRVFLADFDRTEWPEVSLDLATTLKYLHGEVFRLGEECPKGLVVVCHRGLPLGFAKNLGTRCNNLYPKARRIMMDINKWI